jgi:hypothetical protein
MYAFVKTIRTLVYKIVEQKVMDILLARKSILFLSMEDSLSRIRLVPHCHAFSHEIQDKLVWSTHL